MSTEPKQYQHPCRECRLRLQLAQMAELLDGGKTTTTIRLESDQAGAGFISRRIARLESHHTWN